MNTKDDAMRKLGIAGVYTKVPLSKYTERDIIEAFRRNIKASKSKSSKQVIVHESFQVVRRLMNATHRFRAVSRGTVKGEKFANLLTDLTKESQEKARKKEIAEQARVNPVDFKLKKALDQTRGRLTAAVVLNDSYCAWKQKHENKRETIRKQITQTTPKTEAELDPGQNNQSDNFKQSPTKKQSIQKSIKVKRSVIKKKEQHGKEGEEKELAEEQKTMIKNFRFRQIVDSNRGSIRVANILHEYTTMSKKFGSIKKK